MSDSDGSLRILVARPDRLGDVILSTPVFEILKKQYPNSKLTVMVREPIAPVVRGLRDVDEVMIFDPDGAHSGVKGFFRLMKEIRDRQFRIAVVLQSHWKIAAAVFGTGVRHRVGPLSKPHSFLFYNRGVRQRRSLVEMHETDYNLFLLRRLGIRATTRSVPVRAHLSEESKEEGRKWLAQHGWDPLAHPDQKLIIVHPGMAGSALNWPETHYVELIRGLAREGHPVLVTCGPEEGNLLKRIQSELGEVAQRILFYGGPGIGPLDRLASLYCWATVVVAPSTGPLHLAVALGKRVVTFYAPVRVMSAIRWGPYLADDTKASVLVPEVYCGQDFSCLGNLCNYYPCMKSLQVTQALEQVQAQLAAQFARGQEAAK
jgi:heptosyltransferase III